MICFEFRGRQTRRHVFKSPVVMHTLCSDLNTSQVKCIHMTTSKCSTSCHSDIMCLWCWQIIVNMEKVMHQHYTVRTSVPTGESHTKKYCIYFLYTFFCINLELKRYTTYGKYIVQGIRWHFGKYTYLFCTRNCRRRSISISSLWAQLRGKVSSLPMDHHGNLFWKKYVC